MFTGLIQQKSTVERVEKHADGVLIFILRPSDFDRLETGESIAVDGACLTLVSFDEKNLSFFVGAETLKVTTFSGVAAGQTVNLERSLALGQRLGGHMVTGHVDGTAVVTAVEPSENCLGLKIQVSRDQVRWIVPKGSLCLNGVSLTVNMASREDLSVEFLLIPETLSRTNLGLLKTGSLVNVECDQTVKIIAHQFDLYNETRRFS